MDIQPAEISAILKREIENFGAEAEVSAGRCADANRRDPSEAQSTADAESVIHRARAASGDSCGSSAAGAGAAGPGP